MRRKVSQAFLNASHRKKFENHCPTEWISNLVVIEKKDKSLRLCLDPRPLNAAILRELYDIPTPADV